MEENSSAVECLILFYINMKQVLKTKQLVERVFIDQMIKQCREAGFKDYSDEEIKNTWKNLVSKYLNLKTKGTGEEKESWKYYEILDSCYEQSDFHCGVYPKFSEEMVWFLIECFLKRKALKKTQKQSSIVSEIHKEFLHYGYLYITKQDIENKWRGLNLKYEKLKNDPESLKKWPYLQALLGYHDEDGRHIVNMTFTRELTEILIERFTEKKITCVIHGYDSDQVLSEIQSEFKDLGFYFTKDSIKEKWRTLMNVYKFLVIRGKSDTSWIYFDAMRNHFRNDFLFPWGRMNKKIHDQSDGKVRRLRQRSKSAGPEIFKNKSVEPNLVVQLEKVSLFYKSKANEERMSSGKKKTKRSSEERRRSKSRKKLKVQGNQQAEQATKKQENKDQSSEILVAKTEPSPSSHLKLSFDVNQEKRDSTDLSSPTSKVHIINIDHSDIDRSSGNLTINLPSITKQFSDNEFLPLKKRLRVEGDNIEKYSANSNEIRNGFLGFPATQSSTQTLLTDPSEDKRLTDGEMLEIMERINKESSKSDNEVSTNYRGPEELNNYQNMYGGLGQQCLIVPKEERQEDNMSLQSYSAPSAVTQPPVLLLVIKVDGSNNPLKESVPSEVNLKTDGNSNLTSESPSTNNKVAEKRTNISDKQPTLPQASKDFVKPVSPKNKTIILSKKKNLVPLEVNCPETGDVHNNSSETASVSINSASSCNSEMILTENEEATEDNTNLNKEVLIETNELNDICTVGENITVYTTEANENSHVDIKNKPLHTHTTPEEVIFRKPSTIGKKSEALTKPKVLEKPPESNTLPHMVRPPTNTSKVRLPVRSGGKLKEIFISPRELNKIAKLKPENFRAKNILRKVNVTKTTPERSEAVKKVPEGFKYVSQVIKPANGTVNSDSVASKSADDSVAVPPQPFNLDSKLVGVNVKSDEFDNESVMSEAIGDDDGLKDNLLATVIDFQEQNNQEFIEIKNLMKQNNLLQRETNRLLRLMLEKQ